MYVLVVFDVLVYFYFKGIKEYRVFIDILEKISAHSLLILVQAKFLIVLDHDFVIEQYPALCYLVCYHGFRSEEHTSELQSLMRISYAVFCLKNKITAIHKYIQNTYQSHHTNN